MRSTLFGLAALLAAGPLAAQSSIRVCVLDSGRLTEVTARYDRATGDTTVAGRAFASAYPANRQYAASAGWYVNNQPISVGGRRYEKYGLPRVLGVEEVTRSADYQGVPVFVEAGFEGAAEVVYLPVRPGCEFQPYMVEVQATPVRAGETVRGTLSEADPVRDDDSYYDDYLYSARAGERIVVELSSDDFDAFLSVGEGTGGEFESIEDNDDGPDMGTDSRVEITFPATGSYVIRANSYDGGETGRYTLRVTGAETRSSRSGAVPIRVGETVRGTLSATDPLLEDDSYYDLYRLTVSGPTTVEVTLASQDFDAYLAVGLSVDGEMEHLESDDDSAGGTDSRIRIRLPEAGEYLIRANSLSAGDTGSYTLTLRSTK